MHPDQVGFVSGRQAPEGTRRLLNIIKRTELHEMPSLLECRKGNLQSALRFPKLYASVVLGLVDLSYLLLWRCIPPPQPKYM